MLDKNFDCLGAVGDARQGQRVIEEVYSFLGRFVSYPSDYAQTAHALWIIHAHLMDKWDSTPRCVSAWNKDPVFGVIGIQSGPRH